MSARTAVETIQAAIEKLEGLKPGYVEINGWLAEMVDGASGAIDDPDYAPLTADPIIVTLHRTIDAQLAILECARVYENSVWGTGSAETFHRHAVDLATAILGEQS